MIRLAQKKLLLVRGNEAAFKATDAMVATSVAITPVAGDQVSREVEREQPGSQEAYLVNAHQTIRFSIELAPSSSGSPPPSTQPWETLLRACGFAVTYTRQNEQTRPGQVARRDFTLVSSGQETSKIGFVQDGALHVLSRARGTFTVEIAANAIPRLSFDMMGEAAEAVDPPQLTPDFSLFRTPLLSTNTNTPTVEIFGQNEIPLSRFSLNLGNTVVHRSPVGVDPHTLITDRAATAELTIDATDRSIFDPFKKARANEKGEIKIVHGTKTKHLIEILLPNCQLDSGVAYGDDNGILQYTLPLRVLPKRMQGNDEIRITVR